RPSSRRVSTSPTRTTTASSCSARSAGSTDRLSPSDRHHQGDHAGLLRQDGHLHRDAAGEEGQEDDLRYDVEPDRRRKSEPGARGVAPGPHADPEKEEMRSDEEQRGEQVEESSDGHDHVLSSSLVTKETMRRS